MLKSLRSAAALLLIASLADALAANAEDGDPDVAVVLALEGDPDYGEYLSG